MRMLSIMNYIVIQNKRVTSNIKISKYLSRIHTSSSSKLIHNRTLPPSCCIASETDTKNQDRKFKIEKETWAEKYLPTSLIPYAQLSRVNRPAGTYMLLWPCYWSIGLATPTGVLPDTSMMALFGLGAFVMRSAGCTINDMWDKDFDAKVERTNKRPIASGALTRKEALVFLGGQLSIGLAVLTQLNFTSVILGASSMAFVVSYPLMKRFTYWPQAVLGLTFNWGALVGWTAIQGSCNWSVMFPLYAGGIFWTLVYDTLYAHQDKDDDKRIGVKSTALLFNDKTIPILSGFSVACISCLGLAGYSAGMSWPFYIGMGASGLFLGWQVGTANINDPINLQKRFSSNKWFGALVFSSILAGNLI